MGGTMLWPLPLVPLPYIGEGGHRRTRERSSTPNERWFKREHSGFRAQRRRARRKRFAFVTTVMELEAMAISANTGCINPSIARGIISRL